MLKSNTVSVSKLNPVSVYWDYQNVPNKDLISFLKNLAQSQGELVKSYVFDNWKKKPEDKEMLEKQGVECVQVSGTQKDAADHKLLIQLGRDLERLNPLNTIVLVTGDHFGLAAIEEARQFGKKVIGVAREGSFSPDLKNQADKFYTVEQVMKEFASPVEVNHTKSSLNYYEGIYYLIKAIKGCLDEGKTPALGHIANLMRNFLKIPKSEELQILKPDGTLFSKFAKFVDTVAQDGIIKREGQLIYL